MESKETDRYSKMTETQKAKVRAFLNVQKRKQSPKLTPGMRAGLRAKIAQRAEKDPEYAKKVDRKIKEAQERNKKE